MAISVKLAIMRVNDRLRETLGLTREVARRRPLIRGATNVERNLSEEIKTERLTTNEE